MKKIIPILIFVIFTLNIFSNTYVYAASDTWVSQAFKDANDFIKEKPKEQFGFENDFLQFFKNIIKSVNVILLVVLFGISSIAVSISGFRYLVSGAAPDQRQAAREGLRKTFIGMFYGFGAYTIWTISMSVVTLIIGSFK